MKWSVWVAISTQVDAQRATLAVQRAVMINELEDKKVSLR